MSWSVAILLVVLLLVVLLQIFHRRAGAVALIVWCGVAMVVGLREFDGSRDLRIFGLEAEPWNFGAFMFVMLVYNVNYLFKKPKTSAEGRTYESIPPQAVDDGE